MVRFLEKLWLDFISPVAKEVKSMYNDMDKIEVEVKLSLISYGIQKRRIQAWKRYKRHGRESVRLHRGALVLNAGIFLALLLFLGACVFDSIHM